MPNPLAEAFALAAKVRPRIESIVRFDPDPERQWTMNGVPVTESEADSLILAACTRELPGYWWDNVGDKFVICQVTPEGLDYEPIYGGETLTLALLAAVAGLGEE